METNTKTLIRANLLGLAVALVVNYLAVSLPLFGESTAQLSDQYPNLFVPAGLTFSIWGVIYTWLLVFAGCQAAALFNPAMMQRIEPVIQKTGWLFLSICAYNALWLITWHLKLAGLSVVVMISLVVKLLQLNVKAGVGRTASGSLEKWVAHAPFGIYQGWITIALIANATAFLVAIRWTGFGIAENVWTMAMIGAGALIACLTVWRQNNIFHGFAVAWALLGIYLKRSEAADAPEIATTAVVCMGLVLAFSLWRTRNWLTY